MTATGDEEALAEIARLTAELNALRADRVALQRRIAEGGNILDGLAQIARDRSSRTTPEIASLQATATRLSEEVADIWDSIDRVRRNAAQVSKTDIDIDFASLSTALAEERDLRESIAADAAAARIRLKVPLFDAGVR